MILRFLIALCHTLEEHRCTLKVAERHMRDDDYPRLKLSTRLAKLEQALGHPNTNFLVDRSPNRQATVTAAGHSLMEAAKRILEIADVELHKHARGRRRVVIAMSNALTANLLPRVLNETAYLGRHPAIDLKVIEREADSLGLAVKNNDADFALGPRGVLHMGLIAEHVCSWKRVLLYNKTNDSHLKLCRLSVDALFKRLATYSVIIPPKSIIPELEATFLPRPTTGRQIKLPQATLRRAWVAQNLGVAISHEEDQRVGTDNVRSIDLSDHLGTTEMCLYFRERGGKREKISPAAEALVDSIKQVFHVP